MATSQQVPLLLRHFQRTRRPEVPARSCRNHQVSIFFSFSHLELRKFFEFVKSSYLWIDLNPSSYSQDLKKKQQEKLSKEQETLMRKYNKVLSEHERFVKEMTDVDQFWKSCQQNIEKYDETYEIVRIIFDN